MKIVQFQITRDATYWLTEDGVLHHVKYENGWEIIRQFNAEESDWELIRGFDATTGEPMIPQATPPTE